MWIALLFACSDSPNAMEGSKAKPEAPEAPKAEAPKAEVPAHADAPKPAGTSWEPKLGETVDPAGALLVDDVVAAAETWNGKDLTVKGTIREVCQKKGCWHTIATKDDKVNVMVKDKEYEIFLPKDAAGKTALLKGTFLVEMMPEAEAKHYAEDAGRDPSLVKGDQKTFQIDVDGVTLL